MRASVLHEPGAVDSRPLRWSEVDDPEAGAGEVVVEVAACGVCRTDLHVVVGELPQRRRPLIPGHQIVGRVVQAGAGAEALLGRRVGIAWVHRTCGACRPCSSGRENLCEAAQFTGWTVDGGFAERVKAPAAFTYPIPDGFGDREAAPLLCAGIIGYRALRLTALGQASAVPWAGARLGIYGFGAAGHVAIQLARGRGADVYVCTRDRDRHQALAAELGAAWVGGAHERPPVPLDAAVVFAPAGELVPEALRAIGPGGSVVLGGIHMSTIPSFDYALIYGERTVRSVTNNTREDGRAFLAEAAALPVRTHVQAFPLADANEALAALAHDGVKGAAVLTVER